MIGFNIFSVRHKVFKVGLAGFLPYQEHLQLSQACGDYTHEENIKKDEDIMIYKPCIV